MNKLIAGGCVVVGMLVTSQAVFAQRDAGSKIRGDAYEIWSGGNYSNHAYDHVQLLNQYSSEGQTVPPAVIKEHANAIRYNVDSSKRAYSKLSGATATNPEAAKLIASIKAHEEKALELCTMLDKEAKEDGDSPTVMKHCAQAEKELKAAADEHEQLLKVLKIAPFKK